MDVRSSYEEKYQKCMFGTSTPCMTYLHMGYSASSVFTESSHV
jgi:hypothetical protein